MEKPRRRLVKLKISATRLKTVWSTDEPPASQNEQPIPVAAALPPPPPPPPIRTSTGPILKLKTSAPPASSTPSASTPKIRIKSSSFKISQPSTPKTPTLKLTSIAQKPVHRATGHRVLPLGLGYDSEASDREEDPIIEEQFILRMPPGEDAEYIHEMNERREMGGGADLWIKFKDERRAVVNVRGRLYAAALVDLPCIIESSKTIDKKNIYKTADISQMLLVGERIVHEDQVFSIPLIENNLHPHGITPPLQHVRKRRFRKRISNRTIERVEEVVEELLAADATAFKSRYELVDPNAGSDEEPGDNTMMDAYGEEDAEGEDDDMYEEGEEEEVEMEDAEGEDEIDEDAFANEFEQEFASAGMDIDSAPNGSMTVPASQPGGVSASSDEGSDEDEDDGQDADGDLDEDAQEAAQNTQKLREEIADLEVMVAGKTREYESVGNPIVKQRIRTVLDGLKSELEMKKMELNGGEFSDEE